MANLLRIVLGLVEDPDDRRALRADPDLVLAGLDDLCAEDVAAVVDVVRVQVAPEIADRLDAVVGMRPGDDDAPAEGAVRLLLTLCDAVESATPAPMGGTHDVRSRPPGPDRSAHLWAIDGSGRAGTAAHDASARRSVPLAPVPDPPGGFEFSPLELVRLPSGLPEAGIEPGALATVVAVHRDPELHYEIEVGGEDGGRRFLGTVAPGSIGRYTG